MTKILASSPSSKVIPQLQTAGLGGGFWSTWNEGFPPTGGTALGLGTTKLVYGIQLLTQHTIRKITFRIDTAVAASNVVIGLYSQDGNTRYLNTGLIPSTTTGIKVATISPAVVIPAGLYFVFISGDTAGIQVDGVSIAANLAALANQNSIYCGNSANGITGGNAPTTLGAITPSNGAPTLIHFEA
jgi:hypothetical protein